MCLLEGCLLLSVLALSCRALTPAALALGILFYEKCASRIFRKTIYLPGAAAPRHHPAREGEDAKHHTYSTGIERKNMRFGICAPFREVASLKSIPFDYLEENVQRFLVPEQPQETFAALLEEARRLPVPIEAANVLFPGDLTLVATTTQSVDRQRLERHIKTVLQRAAQVGIQVIVFGSGRARACPPGHDHDDAIRQIGEHLATWSVWARDYGVQIVLEPLRYEETNTLNTVAESGALVSQVADTGARLLADIYHMACNGEAPESILPYAGLLSHVHVAEREGRTAPGVHGEDFRPYFAALHQGGYDRRISIECNWRDLSAEVDRAIAVLKEQWAASAQ
jgi:sugar phosphate isomerase/epimerase